MSSRTPSSTTPSPRRSIAASPLVTPLTLSWCAGSTNPSMASSRRRELGTTALPPTWSPWASWSPSRKSRYLSIVMAPALYTCCNTLTTWSSPPRARSFSNVSLQLSSRVHHEGPRPPPPLHQRLSGAATRRSLPTPSLVRLVYP
jgi:hypothetical protein